MYRKPEGVGLLKSPPLRRKEDAEALWEGLRDGTIPSVATDESIALVADKRRRLEENPAYHVSGGLNQIELRLAVMHSEMVTKRGMPVQQLVYCLSTGPARLFGLYPQKGTIQVGSDADVVLFDPNVSWRVRNEDLHQGTDYNIFEGWDLQGRAVTTILRGNVLVENGKFVGPDRLGEWLPRQLDRAAIEATNTLSSLA
jgi:dihydropyrimidinase